MVRRSGKSESQPAIARKSNRHASKVDLARMGWFFTAIASNHFGADMDRKTLASEGAKRKLTAAERERYLQIKKRMFELFE